MKYRTTGEHTEYGVYVSARPPDVSVVADERAPLAGRAGARYVRIPTPLAVLLSPVAGAVFVLAFPLLVIGAIAVALTRGALSAMREYGREHAYVAELRWSPQAAYLKHPGEPDRGEQPDERPENPVDPDLQRRVDARREREAAETERR